MEKSISAEDNRNKQLKRLCEEVASKMNYINAKKRRRSRVRITDGEVVHRRSPGPDPTCDGSFR